MAKSGGIFRNVLVWTYSRGTIPYDIICALILLFIFLTPRSCFIKRTAAQETNSRVCREIAGTTRAAVDTASVGPARR